MRNRDLRRAESAFALGLAAEYASWVAILVYAYRQGGAIETGVVATIQLVPAGVLVSLVGVAADRLGAARVYALCFVLQAVTAAGVALVLGIGGPPLVVYAVAIPAAAAAATPRPTHASVTPLLARSPTELGAANVLAGWTTAVVSLAGPALVGVVLAFSGPGTAFACAAVADGIAALLAFRLPRPRGSADGGSLRDLAVELGGGLAVLRDRRSVRLVIALIAAMAVVVGAVEVLAVVLALGPLGLGAGGPGYLTAAWGAGGVAGAVAALSLIGRRRFVPHLAGAALVCGAAFVVLGIRPDAVAAFLLLGVAGAAALVFDVAAQTLLQRTTPTGALSRVFALVESLSNLGWAVGSLGVPALVTLGGIRAALMVFGVLLPLIVVLRLRALGAIDAEATVPVVEIALLRGMDVFALLPAPALEGLAHALEPLAVSAGDDVVVEGDEGDRFYVVADGTLEVRSSGAPVARLGRGDGFGEIALLRDVPRTATVTALTDANLYALGRDAFLVAVTRHTPTRGALHELADARLAELAVGRPGADEVRSS